MCLPHNEKSDGFEISFNACKSSIKYFSGVSDVSDERQSLGLTTSHILQDKIKTLYSSSNVRVKLKSRGEIPLKQGRSLKRSNFPLTFGEAVQLDPKT